MEEVLRRLTCRSLLTEAFVRIETEIDQWRYLLATESSVRPDSLGRHASFIASFHDRLAKLIHVKVMFHRGSDSEAVQSPLRGLTKILGLLEQRFVAPLQQLAAAQDRPESELLEKLDEIKTDRTWDTIIDLAKAGLKDAVDLRQQTFDDARRMILPPGKPRTPAKVFLAYTSDSRTFAQPFVKLLRERMPGNQFVPWEEAPEFQTGHSIYEGLEAVAGSYDMGIAIFGPADSYDVRRHDCIPLCNVVLEFGMLAGRLGRTRSVAIHGSGGIPGMTDTNGILGLKYSTPAGQAPSNTDLELIVNGIARLLEVER